MHTPQSLHTALTNLGIPFTTHHHAPIFTVEEGHEICAQIPGAHIKNLFLRDKARNYYLVTALQSRLLNLKTLGKHLGSKDNLSFADAETLYDKLGITPGSVSPLALINAQPGSLRFILDEGIFTESLVNPHPLINSQTTSLTPADLLRAIESWGHPTERLNLGLFPKNI